MKLDEKYFEITPIGKWVRYIHERCSEGKDACLNVCRTEKGWAYNCWRCGVSGFRSISNASTGKLLRHVNTLNMTYENEQGEIILPEDYTPDISRQGMKWLLKYLTPTEIQEHKIGFSPSLNRIIFPLFKKDKLVYWQGRAIDWKPDYKTPKYKNVRASKDTMYAIRNPGSTILVLVEDIVSAIKVSKHASAIALLGSSVEDKKLYDLSKHFSIILMWLDYDKAEYSLNKTMRCRKFGLNVRSLITKLDPKEYSSQTIKGHLEGHCA